jgi:hypothetical protein
MVDVSHADHLCAYAQQELERTRQLESVLDQIHGRRQQFVAAHSEVHACAATRGHTISQHTVSEHLRQSVGLQALKHRLEELVGKSRALELTVRQKVRATGSVEFWMHIHMRLSLSCA